MILTGATGGCSCGVAAPDLPSATAGFLLLAFLLFLRRAPALRRVRRD